VKGFEYKETATPKTHTDVSVFVVRQKENCNIARSHAIDKNERMKKRWRERERK